MRGQVQFSEELLSLKSPISTLEYAVSEILECEILTRLLVVILTAGNIINGVSSLFSPIDPCMILLLLFLKGTFAGGAYGFKIESLSQLKQTKQKHPEISFLHYITEVCRLPLTYACYQTVGALSSKC